MISSQFQREDIERSPEQVYRTLTNRHRHRIVSKLGKAASPLTQYIQLQVKGRASARDGP